MERQRNQNNLKQFLKEYIGGKTLTDFKTYSKAKIIKTVWYWQRDRHTDSRNRKQSPETNPYKYGQFIFNKSTEAIQ